MKISGRQKRLLKRLLMALSKPGARLKIGTGAENGAEKGAESGAEPVLLLISPGARPRRLDGLDGQLLARCQREGLIEGGERDGWVISEAGRMALRRWLAGGGDPFILQHQHRHAQSRMTDAGRRSVLVSDSASPLAWLARRKGSDGQPLINSWQLAAGERMARDFYLAGLEPRLTSNWEIGPSGGGRRRSAPGAGSDMSDCRLAAIERLNRALDHLGPEMGSLLLDVCCFQMGLGDCEKKRNWPRRSGKLVVRIALESLARHYGLTPPENGWRKGGGSPILHWGTPDYRPDMDSHPDS